MTADHRGETEGISASDLKRLMYVPQKTHDNDPKAVRFHPWNTMTGRMAHNHVIVEDWPMADKQALGQHIAERHS